VAANGAMLANITGALGECVKFADALHGDFAAFGAHLRGGEARRRSEILGGESHGMERLGRCILAASELPHRAGCDG
jgi:hypothetical protein